MKQALSILALVLLLSALGGCLPAVQSPQSQSPSTVVATSTMESTAVPNDESNEDAFPTILDAQLTRQADGVYNIAVTISSLYDTPPTLR